jgi:hypothetical protein
MFSSGKANECYLSREREQEKEKNYSNIERLSRGGQTAGPGEFRPKSPIQAKPRITQYAPFSTDVKNGLVGFRVFGYFGWVESGDTDWAISGLKKLWPD